MLDAGVYLDLYKNTESVLFVRDGTGYFGNCKYNHTMVILINLL